MSKKATGRRPDSPVALYGGHHTGQWAVAIDDGGGRVSCVVNRTQWIIDRLLWRKVISFAEYDVALQFRLLWERSRFRWWMRGRELNERAWRTYRKITRALSANERRILISVVIYDEIPAAFQRAHADIEVLKSAFSALVAIAWGRR